MRRNQSLLGRVLINAQMSATSLTVAWIVSSACLARVGWWARHYRRSTSNGRQLSPLSLA
jgi:hypothetical protein